MTLNFNELLLFGIKLIDCICMAPVAIFPCFHLYLQLYMFGPTAAQLAFKSIMLLILMGTLYILGALCYMFKIPERLSPGKFDLWFHSHQIFHTLVVLAGLTYFHSMSLMAEARLNQRMHQNNDLAFLSTD